MRNEFWIIEYRRLELPELAKTAELIERSATLEDAETRLKVLVEKVGLQTGMNHTEILERFAIGERYKTKKGNMDVRIHHPNQNPNRALF